MGKKFEFPAERPHNDADFTTPKGHEVEAVAVAVRLSQSQRSPQPDQIDFLFRVKPGQVADRVSNPGAGIQAGSGDVGGWFVWHTGSLNGDAPAITMKTLRVCGYDPATLRAAYASYPQAISTLQQVAVDMAGQPPEAIAEAQANALLVLALIENDVEAMGLGTKTVKLVVMDDSYKGVSRLRCTYVNPIPVAPVVADVHKLLRGGLNAALSVKQTPTSKPPAKTGSSTPPPGGGKLDSIDF